MTEQIAKPRRCISWIAVSSKPQTEKESPEEQREGNRKTIEMLGGVVVAELVVDGESREIDGFEEACRMIDAYAQLDHIMQQRSADLLVCRDMTRLGRTLGLLGQTINRLHNAGIAVYSRSAPPSSLEAAEQAGSQGATFMLAIESALAQVEMQKFRRNHTFGMLGRAKRGLFPRGKKFGWDIAPDGEIFIVEEQADAIRYAYDAYIHSGLPVDAICRQMNEIGYVTATGVQWTATTFKILLVDVWKYAGYIEFNRHSKTGRPYYRGKAAWPPIIDEKTAAAVLEERKRRKASRRGVNSSGLFSGVCECLACGGNIHATPPNGTHRARYRCRYTCHGSYVMEYRIIDAMLDFLDDLAEMADADAIQPSPDMHERYEAQLVKIEQRIAAINEQRKRHARNNAMGLIDDTEFMELMQETSDVRTALESQRSDIQSRLETVETAEQRARRIADIRQFGRERMLSDDKRATNAWLRQNFRIYIAKNRVAQIHIKSGV